MAPRLSSWLPLVAVLVLLYAGHAHAFGAGNIGSLSKIEGQNWRHGDIEDTLLTILTARAFGGKKFSKLDVKRTYFGNWLRDYSQAVDVGTVKYVSAEAIRLLLWILGFMSFGYGTAEFEVTKERLGCYRPEEHIDNPKDYADNQDARQYDRRLRGPIDEARELSIDERTGLKQYIASEDQGITTSAAMVRDLFRRCIELGRRYKQSDDKRDFCEALRLLGTACHCLEDFSAHSNYTELALIELGERDVFPHVGRRTQIELPGARHPVYPITTGTFGGVDFLHSVMGEFTDKSTQYELDELEGTLQQSQNADTSLLQDLLDKLPPGILGDTDQKGKAEQLKISAQAQQMQNMHITPKEPEAFTQQVEEIQRQIYPLFEFHDNLMKSISEAVEQIPVLPDLIEQLQDQLSIFVFSLMAPFVVPVVNQIKNELRTGSSEIIQSSKAQQHNVFQDDGCSDPTHSMLSKDHFSNILNEPAGKVASQVLKWVVPQIVACWDDDNIDIHRTNDRIINGVFHHPALRDYGEDGASDGRHLMFQVIEQWWTEKSDGERDDLRDKLSRDGVEQGRNHKEGVHDGGHGCGKPLGLPNMKTSQSSGAGGGRPSKMQSQISDAVGDAVGGGAFGSIVGGLAGAVGGGLLGGAFGGDKAEKKRYSGGGFNNDGDSYTSQITETGHVPGGYGQQEQYGRAQMSQTQYSSGGREERYQRYEQDGLSGRTGSGFEQRTETQPTYGDGHEQRIETQPTYGGGYEQRTETQPTYGGGYEQRTERRFDQPGGSYTQEMSAQQYGSSGQQYGGHSDTRYRHKDKDSDDNDDSNDEDDYEKKMKKQRKKEEKRREQEREEREERQYGRRGSGSRERRRSGSRKRRDSDEYKRHSGGGHGGHQSDRRDEYSQSAGDYARDEYSQSSDDYARQENRSPSRSRAESARYSQQQSYGGGDGYGRHERHDDRGDSFGGGEYGHGGNDDDGYGRRDEMPGRVSNDEGSGGRGGYAGGSSGYGDAGNSGYGDEGNRRW